MVNEERRGRYQGCNVVQGRSTIDPSRAAEELVHEIVEYDEIVSPRELFDWLGNAKRKLSRIFASLVERKRDIEITYSNGVYTGMEISMAPCASKEKSMVKSFPQREFKLFL